MTVFFELIIRLDQIIFSAINSLAGKSSILDGLAKVGADDHIVPLVLILLVILLVFLAKDAVERKSAIEAVICAFVAVIIVSVVLAVLNLLWFRPRPFVSQQVNLIFYHPTDSAFPSNAASLAFALSFAVLFYRWKIGVVMLALSVYLSLSRVFCGIHYPLDVLGGMLLGLSAAAISLLFAPAYRFVTEHLYRIGNGIATAWNNPPP